MVVTHRMREGVKVEWAKSRARASRYLEEINIVREEMKRTIRFLRWKSAQWRQRGVAKQNHGPLDEEYSNGLLAYAARQAAICEGQATQFLKKWAGVDAMIALAKLECDKPELFYERRRKELEKDATSESPEGSATTK